MVDIIHQLVIRASSDNVYRAIATQEGLAGWWTEDVVAETLEGGFAEFRFGNPYFIKMRILRIEKISEILIFIYLVVYIKISNFSPGSITLSFNRISKCK